MLRWTYSLLLSLLAGLTVAQSRNELASFRSEALKTQNKYRSIHQSSPLTLDTTLSSLAQAESDRLALNNRLTSDGIKFIKFRGQSVGACVASNTGHMTGSQATELWYTSSSDYNYRRHSPLSSFTQMVWANSKLVGFGLSLSSSGSYYVVALYWPAGNIMSKARDNVFSAEPQSGENIELTEEDTHPTTSSEEIGEAITETLIDENNSGANDHLLAFNDDGLTAHNQYRKSHQVADLKLDSQLRLVAQKEAERLAEIDLLDQSGLSALRFKGKGVGGNYAQASNYEFTGKQVSDLWYKGEIEFSYITMKPLSSFTQMVWHDTKWVAFGKAESESGKVFIVALYSPPGNVVGREKTNLFSKN